MFYLFLLHRISLAYPSLIGT